MFSADLKKGTWGSCEYLQVGRGKEKLVIFPPLHDSLFDLSDSSLHLKGFLEPLMRHFTVYILSRKKNLSAGYTTRDMAADYAQALQEASLGPITLMGISIGGMIAQHFAYDYPEQVKKLILIASAYRLGPEGIQIARRWIPWAKLKLWKEMYEDHLDLSYSGKSWGMAKFLKPLILKHFLQKIRDPYDFIISGQAAILHDSLDILEKIQMPVFIIAGTRDPFFPEAFFYDMEERMPNLQLLILKGARHGVYDENRKFCVKALVKWLSQPNSKPNLRWDLEYELKQVS